MDLVGEEGGERGEQRRRLEQAVAQGREGGAVAVPEAAAREPHVPVGELLDELGDLPPGGGAVEVVHALADGRDRRLQPRERPAVEVARSAPGAAVAKSVGAEVLGVRVEDPERVGVPEGQQELAHRFADRVDREAVARPGLLRGQVVPAEGVGAVGGDHVPGLDHVALALRHLLALGVEDQAEADAVAVAGGVEEQGRLGEQRVEPAAGLVDRLADEVGREALLEQLLVLERVVELGEGHRAAVVPGVDHRLDPAHLAAALARTRASPRRCRGGAGRRAPRRRRARAARRPSRRRSGRRSPRRRTPRSAAACPSSGRARAPSRRCSPAICRSGRA